MRCIRKKLVMRLDSAIGRRNSCMNQLIKRHPSVKGHDYRSSSKNSEKNRNSVTNRDDRQKNIPVITTSQENNDDDIEFTKSQVIEQEVTKELLSGIISAPSISFEAMERIPSVSHPSSSLDTTQNLVHLFQNAI